jgi:ribonuclease BN (tRNA processing enzyme)
MRQCAVLLFSIITFILGKVFFDMVTINFYGVRGSHPAADAKMTGYGGNTSCVELVKANKNGVLVPVIVDAGSGLIKLGYSMARKLAAGEYSKTFSMLFTHLHPDHTEGFTFFAPIFLPFAEIYILGMEVARKNAGTVLKNKMMPTVYPIGYKDLKSRRVHRVLADGQRFFISQDGVPLADDADPLFEISVLQASVPSHPLIGAMYYRIRDTEDNSTIACIWDIESRPGGDARVIKFIQGADVLIHDTQYTEEEYGDTAVPVQGFGHSTYAMALENAQKGGVKYLFPFHYNPRHSDETLDIMYKKHASRKSPELIMSREGLSVTLKDGVIIRRETLPAGFAK